MGGTDVQSAAPVRVGPRAGVRGQPKSPGKAPPGAETSPGRLARASAKLEWKHARPANASPRHRPAPRKIPPLPEVRLLHSFLSPSADTVSSTDPASPTARSGLSPIFSVADPTAPNASEQLRGHAPEIPAEPPNDQHGADDPTVQQGSRPAQAKPQNSQTPSNQSSSIARRTKKRRNKPNRTTQETRQSREEIRDLRRRLTLIEDLLRLA